MAEPAQAAADVQCDEDATLARCAAGGDSEAFRALVVRYQAPLLAVVRNLLPCAADRQDVAQDAFLAVWLHLAEYDPRRGAFFTWLVRIARNRALNLRERHAPRPMAELPERPSTARADEAAIRDDAHRRLDAALAELPDDQRAAFVLAEIHGLAYAEVAEIERVPLGTVKSRAARAREKLRAALAPEEDDS